MAQFECIECGYGSQSWYGKCPQCGQFNTFTETLKPKDRKEVQKANFVKLSTLNPLSLSRMKTGVGEFDRVLGGGLVKGEALLLAGEPGIGKSTLLLKALGNLNTAYVSGEESGEQIRERAARIKVNLDSILFSSQSQVEGILEALEDSEGIDIVVIDSIQTIYSKNIESPVGSVSQLKEVSARLIDFAKRKNVAIIIIGHVTKDGDIAGPKTLEHLVDCVLYFEGERLSLFRILRAYKNRFGPTDEVGIFEMAEAGLLEVTNPTVFIDPEKPAIGKATVGVMEGTRALFFEVQALSVNSVLSVPRRVVKGVDYNKVQLLLAVIRKNLNINLDHYDIYINVVGGISIKSTASDLGIVAAIISSIKNIPLKDHVLFTGEIGLLGEIRPVLNQKKILSEAKRFGFSTVFSSLDIQSVKQMMSVFGKV